MLSRLAVETNHTRNQLTNELADELGLTANQIVIRENAGGVVVFVAKGVPYSARTTFDGDHLIRGTCRRGAQAAPTPKIPASALTKLKAEVAQLSKTYWPTAWPKELSAAFDRAQVVLLDDDQTQWSGFLTGAQGRAAWNVGLKQKQPDGTFPATNTYFNLQWHKMPSGKYELNGYFS